MLNYSASIPLSTQTLTCLAELIRSHRRRTGTRWRRLDPGQQALMVLAHLRNGDTYQRLAAGFRIGVSTIYATCARPPRCWPPRRYRCNGWCT